MSTLSALSACTSARDEGPGGVPASTASSSSPDPSGSRARLAPATDPTAVLDVGAAGDLAAQAAVALSAHLLVGSPAVVIAGGDDEGGPAAFERAAAVAAGAGVPVFLPAAVTADEVRRLGASQVWTVGTAASAWAQRTFTGRGDPRVLEAGDPRPAGARPSDRPVVLVTGAAWEVTATASARALGAGVVTVPGADPRAGADVVEHLHGSPAGQVIGLGAVFGSPEQFAHRVAVARTGVQVPGGGQLPLVGRRVVALYGTPGTASLGLLGEQPLQATLERARDVAARYDGLGGLPAVPALEVITTVASGSAGPDGDYSNELDPADLEPWVTAAAEAGVGVVLDLQSGRSDFLSQARRYESLLRYPHVGLALDPEWRLEPDQEPLEQIGSVGAAEVNGVGDWLAQLVRDHDLPQKILLLHQFRTSMVRDRDLVDTSHDELVTVVHADGHGSPRAKRSTYRALTAGPPPGVVWGWKNFLDEDDPTFSAQETAAMDPTPVFVSYQ